MSQVYNVLVFSRIQKDQRTATNLDDMVWMSVEVNDLFGCHDVAIPMNVVTFFLKNSVVALMSSQNRRQDDELRIAVFGGRYCANGNRFEP